MPNTIRADGVKKLRLSKVETSRSPTKQGSSNQDSKTKNISPSASPTKRGSKSTSLTKSIGSNLSKTLSRKSRNESPYKQSLSLKSKATMKAKRPPRFKQINESNSIGTDKSEGKDGETKS